MNLKQILLLFNECNQLLKNTMNSLGKNSLRMDQKGTLPMRLKVWMQCKTFYF